MSSALFMALINASLAASVTNWGVCQGPISHNNEQTQSVEGII